MKEVRLILTACILSTLFLSCKQNKAPTNNMESLDNKHFELMTQGKFEESLKIALKMEEMSRQAGDTVKPWYYLKIADSYNGMKNYQKSIEWISKAVYERKFNNYKIFLETKYKNLQLDSTFQKLITVMKDRIGLNHPAKDFTVSLLNGDSFNLSSRIGKVVLIDFWDVRCAPCIQALPELKNLYEQYNKEGFEIIGISLDTDKELLMKFLDKNSLPWPISCSYKGFYKDETALIYGINATPSTWLVDRKGILRFNEIKGDELKTAIESLLIE
jgi:peroxiredoxin